MNRIQGYQNRAQGGSFEQQLQQVCEYYSAAGIAEVAKTPEPIRILSRPNKAGQFLACFVKCAEPDFKGTLRGGRTVIFEAKSTSTDKMHQKVVTEVQTAVLDRYSRLGAVCFVMITFDLFQAYRIPWEHWNNMKSQYGRMYITKQEAEPYRVPVDHLGRILFLSGL